MDLWKKVLGMAIVGLCVGSTQVHAAPITLFNTGLGGLGTVDPNYDLIASDDPANPGPDAIVADPSAVQWIANDLTSKWISPSPIQDCCPAGSGNPDGTYIYQTTFDLTGLNPLTASITGRWSTDDTGTDILLNVLSTGNSTPPGSYAVFTGFSIPVGSAFIAGVNTLAFVTSNDNCPTCDGNPTGVRVEFLSATADPVPAVPEPASLMLLGAGLAGIGIWSWKRKSMKS